MDIFFRLTLDSIRVRLSEVDENSAQESPAFSLHAISSLMMDGGIEKY